MLRMLLADINFNNNIVRGLLRRKNELDIVRAQDVGLEMWLRIFQFENRSIKKERSKRKYE